MVFIFNHVDKGRLSDIDDVQETLLSVVSMEIMKLFQIQRWWEFFAKCANVLNSVLGIFRRMSKCTEFGATG